MLCGCGYGVPLGAGGGAGHSRCAAQPARLGHGQLAPASRHRGCLSREELLQPYAARSITDSGTAVQYQYTFHQVGYYENEMNLTFHETNLL